MTTCDLVTDMQKQSKRALIEYKIVEPFVHAAALGSACGSFAFVMHGPAFNWSLLGGSASLFWYWGRANLSRPKAKRATRTPGRRILVNSGNGSRSLVFNQVAQGFITRDSWGELFLRWVRGKPRVRPQRLDIDKPRWMSEQAFSSHYKGHPVQLLESDVTRFLIAAWRHRSQGSGLSERRWVRGFKDSPQWYKNLGTHWYYALINLIDETETMSGRQLITINVEAQHYTLTRDPHETLEALKWAESQKTN